ncbi:hypothetical protein ACLOAV_001696 [Pseudogymnoascus australis]
MSGPGRSADGNSRDITYDGGVEAAPTIGQAPLQGGVGPRRCTLKVSKNKPKKWSPFDLGGPEGEVDTGATRAAIPNTDNPVPKLPTGVQKTSYTSIAESKQLPKQLQECSPTPSIISRERCDSFSGNCNTNYRATPDIVFNAAFPQLRNTPAKSPQERSIIHKEDPEDTKLRLEHIMARIDDAFDVEEWDPDLPAGNSNNSPEQLTAEPQKITYTTVGSVAKDDAVTTFTPPVRIQREGSGRRLSVVPAPRGSDNYYNRNQQPGNNSGANYGPPANLRNPKFAQQQYASPSPLDMAEFEQLNLTDLEKEVLLNSINATAGAPSNDQGPQATSTTNMPLNDTTSGNFSVQKMLQEETSGPSAHLTGSSTFAGLNKMQTLQRLAQFENPAQVFAKGRLAEFKAVKMKQQMSEKATSGAKDASQDLSFEHGSKTGVPQFGDTGSDPYKNSIVSYGSQYPGQENGNPLQQRYNSFGREYPMDGYGSKAQLAAPPGYPQPLTAGPPRQGQNSVAFNRLAWTSGYNQLADNQQQLQSPQVEKQYSPWNNTCGNSGQQPGNQQQFRSSQAENQYSPWNSTSGNAGQQPGYLQQFQSSQAEKQYSPWNNTSGNVSQPDNQQQFQPSQAENQYSPWNSTSGNAGQQPGNQQPGNQQQFRSSQAENQYSPWNNTSGNAGQQPGNQQQFQSSQAEKQYSPWNNTSGNAGHQARPFSSTGQSHIRDTLSLAEMAKYYPNGFGPNFQYGGECEELDEDTKLSNLGLADDSLEAKQRRRAEKRDEWFYSGLSRLDMTTTDHIVELENRDKGIVPSAPRANMANRENLSVEEIRRKTDAECAAPLMNNLFGTLVAYSDNVMQPTNRRVMSRFFPSPEWALDTSEEGKKSIFGDSGVVPPKRSGKDPRYTRSKLSEI